MQGRVSIRSYRFPPARYFLLTRSAVGKILCRFRDKTDEVKALGEYIRNCFAGTFEPFFFICDEENHRSDRIPLGILTSTDAPHRHETSIVDDMCLKGMFVMEDIEITVKSERSSISISLCLREPTSSQPSSSKNENGFPISGFPRALMSEKDLQSPGKSSRYAQGQG